jgi:uncharacterized Fe-S radical SAM superfamily protein PflX
MILYSVIPTEVIFQGMEQYNPQYEVIELQGVSMQVERISYNEARIVRLYSLNPQDFLNPELSPGTLIVYGPTIISS